MPNLRGLRQRKQSVQSTKKITSAMKLISASKLRKAQEQAEAARPYALLMEDLFVELMTQKDFIKSDLPSLLRGSGSDQTHLFLIVSSNRGLCGGFNSGVTRYTQQRIKTMLRAGKTVKLICYGHKSKEHLSQTYGSMILQTFSSFGSPRFQDALTLWDALLSLFGAGTIDHCTVIYNHFISALKYQVTERPLIPFYTSLEKLKNPLFPPDGPNQKFMDPLSREENLVRENKKALALHSQEEVSDFSSSSVYEYEPSREKVLTELIPRHMKAQIFQILLESAASEHSSRVAAMDAATRNAEEMMKKLNLTYHRTRQAYITKELIEIISGADAL